MRVCVCSMFLICFKIFPAAQLQNFSRSVNDQIVYEAVLVVLTSDWLTRCEIFLKSIRMMGRVLHHSSSQMHRVTDDSV